jgi:hypothetical protein
MPKVLTLTVPFLETLLFRDRCIVHANSKRTLPDNQHGDTAMAIARTFLSPIRFFPLSAKARSKLLSKGLDPGTYIEQSACCWVFPELALFRADYAAAET